MEEDYESFTMAAKNEMISGNDFQDNDSKSQIHIKRPPLELLQKTMASSMANIIHRMTNKNHQNNCLTLLDTKTTSSNCQQLEQKLLCLLQDIDKDLTTTGKKKKQKKKKGKIGRPRKTQNVQNSRVTRSQTIKLESLASASKDH